MKIILLTLIAVVLTGCATSNQIAVGPNGKPMHMITCGAGAYLQYCYEKAASVCPNGYQFIDRQTGSTAAVFHQPNSSMIMMGPQTMAIECKEPK